MSSKETSKVRTSAYILSVVALLSSILSYMSTISMGFPDGHLTEFELAVKPLCIGYSILGLLLGILFYVLARFSSKSNSKIGFYLGILLFILLIVGLAVLYFYFKTNLNHGGGG